MKAYPYSEMPRLMPPEADLFAWQKPIPHPVGVPPEVCSKFEELALGLADGSLSGYAFKRYSADAILHRIRWHFTIDRRNRAFKINDHWSAPLARWWLSRHPQYEGFFELRERISDAYKDDEGNRS